MHKAYFFYSLDTGHILNRNQWTELPIPTDVVQWIHTLAAQSAAGLTFTDAHGAIYDDDDEEEYTPEDDDEDDDGNNPDTPFDAMDDDELQDLWDETQETTPPYADAKSNDVAGEDKEDEDVPVTAEPEDDLPIKEEDEEEKIIAEDDKVAREMHKLFLWGTTCRASWLNVKPKPKESWPASPTPPTTSCPTFVCSRRQEWSTQVSRTKN